MAVNRPIAKLPEPQKRLIAPPAPKAPPHSMLYPQWYLWVLRNDWQAFVCVEEGSR